MNVNLLDIHQNCIEHYEHYLDYNKSFYIFISIFNLISKLKKKRDRE